MLLAVLFTCICTSSWSCGKKAEPGCDPVEVVPGEQARVTVARAINDKLLTCSFSIETIVNVETEEDVSGKFSVDILSPARSGDTCKAQIAITMIDEDLPPGEYKASVRIDYDYSGTDSRVSSFKHAEICITIPGDPSTNTGIGGAGGATNNAENVAGSN